MRFWWPGGEGGGGDGDFCGETGGLLNCEMDTHGVGEGWGFGDGW